MQLFALTTHYSWDKDVQVLLYPSETDAFKAMRRQYKEEVRIQTEENEHVIGEDMEVTFDENAMTATVTIDFEDQKDVMTWTVTEVSEHGGINPKDLMPRGVMISAIDWEVDKEDMTDEEYEKVTDSLPTDVILTPEMLGKKSLEDFVDIISDKYEWLINTCYIAGIPEGMTDIEAIKMHLQNLSVHLTANDCGSLFNTIKEASPVIGGKIWTENDIASELRETNFSDNQKNIDAVLEHMQNTDVLDDATDDEWDVIHEAIDEASVNDELTED